jgi:hypothetical protein
MKIIIYDTDEFVIDIISRKVQGMYFSNNRIATDYNLSAVNDTMELPSFMYKLFK